MADLDQNYHDYLSNLEKANNDYYMALNLASKHFNTDQDFNEKNYGLGIGKRLGNNQSVQGGVYDNSLGKTSYYGEYNKDFDLGINNIKAMLGLSAGLVSGYKDNVVPYVTPTFTIGKNGKNLKLRYIPEIKDVTPAVVGLQAEMPINIR